MSTAQQVKLEEHTCADCEKQFSSLANYQIHVKTKHPPKDSAPQGAVEKTEPAPKPKLSKKGFDQYQEELEDKIYTFMGELGEKHNVKETDNISEESDKIMGQANYLENNVVRTPFELEFDVKNELPTITFENPRLQSLFKLLEDETLALNEKLMAERSTWQLLDPIEMDNFDQQQFSLVNISNVLNNYPKKGLNLHYPQMSVFLLWLAKICKPQAWQQMYLIVGHTVFRFKEHLAGNEKSQAAWKAFTSKQPKGMDKMKEVEEFIGILDSTDVEEFLRLYYKWVTFFDLF